MLRPLRSLVHPLLCLALLGCSTQSFRVTVLRPAEFDLSQHRTVAVEGIQGEGGDVLRDLLAGGLSRNRWLDLVDRRDSAAIQDELRRTRGDLFDPETVAELGRLVGAKALIHGNVVSQEYVEEVQIEEWVDRDQKPHVSKTRSGEARLTVTLRISSTETGKVLFGETLTKRATDRTYATDAEPDPIDPAPLFESCRSAVVRDVLARISPREELVVVTLYKDGDIPLLEAGNNLARIGEWDEAIDTYTDALESLPPDLAEYRYKPLFNLGVAHEYTNRFEEARRFLKDAYRVSAESLIAAELESLRRRERDHEELRKQGLVP